MGLIWRQPFVHKRSAELQDLPSQDLGVLFFAIWPSLQPSCYRARDAQGGADGRRSGERYRITRLQKVSRAMGCRRPGDQATVWLSQSGEQILWSAQAVEQERDLLRPNSAERSYGFFAARDWSRDHLVARSSTRPLMHSLCAGWFLVAVGEIYDPDHNTSRHRNAAADQELGGHGTLLCSWRAPGAS